MAPLHQEDLCQALSIPPEKKYQQRDGGPGLAQIGALFRSLPITADREQIAAAFYRAFVFNVVAAGTDAHAKNYSVMLDKKTVRLAPLYDLLTFAGYWDGRSQLSSAMSVGGEYALDRISMTDLAKAGGAFGIRREDAEHIVESATRGMVGAFESARATLAESTGTVPTIADDVMRGLNALPLVR